MVPWTSNKDDCIGAELMQETSIVEEVISVEEEEEDSLLLTYLEEIAVFTCQFVTSSLIHDRYNEQPIPWRLDTLCFQVLLLGLQLLLVAGRYIVTARRRINFRDPWLIISAVLCVLFISVFIVVPLLDGISSIGTFVALYAGQVLIRLLVRGTRIAISAPCRAHVSDKTGLCLLVVVLMYVLAWLPTFLDSLYSYAQFTCLCMRPRGLTADELENHVF